MIAYYAARAGVARAVVALNDALKTDSKWEDGFPKVALEDNDKATYEITFDNTKKYYSTNNINGAGEVTGCGGVSVPVNYVYIVSEGCYNRKKSRVAVMIKWTRPSGGDQDSDDNQGAGGNQGSDGNQGAGGNQDSDDNQEPGSSGPPWKYALFGCESLSIGGTADVVGAVGTNASSLTVGGSSTVSGDQKVNAGQSMPAVTDPFASATLSGGRISTTQTLSPGRYTAIAIPSGKSYTITLSAGTYSFSSFDIANKGKIAISSGPVYIYVSGDIKLTGGDCVVNTSHNATNCIFYGTSTCTSIEMCGGADAYFGVYAPSATVSFAGTSDMHGSAIGKYAEATGTAQIIYDSNFTDLVTENENENDNDNNDNGGGGGNSGSNGGGNSGNGKDNGNGEDKSDKGTIKIINWQNIY